MEEKKHRTRAFFISALNFGIGYKHLSKITGVGIHTLKGVVKGTHYYKYPHTKITLLDKIKQKNKKIRPKKVHVKINKEEKQYIKKVKSFEPESWRKNGLDFIRQKVRDRDNNTCIICNEIWIEGCRRFDVHHKEVHEGRNARYSYDKNNMDKLITICHGCHCLLHTIIRRTGMSTDEILNKKEHLFTKLDK